MIYEYKIHEVKKKRLFKGIFDGQQMEKLLNQHAEDGWEFDKVISGETQVLLNDTFMVVFKRPKD